MNPNRTYPDPFDLRDLFPSTAAYAPDDAPSSSGGASSSAGSELDDLSPSGGAAGEGEDTEPDDEGEPEVIRDPKSKALHDEAKTWRLKFKEAEAKVKTLEETNNSDRLTADNRLLRLRLAFERALSGSGCQDVEAAWKLAEEGLAAVEVKADGTLDTSKVGTIVNHLVEKHPYFFSWPDEQEQEQAKDTFPAEASGRRTDGQRKGRGVPAGAALYAKFPALRGR